MADHLTPESLRFLSQLVADTVELRLEAGHDPDDIACTAWEMWETAIRVHVDGCWPEADRG